jgi:hypothetical protein
MAIELVAVDDAAMRGAARELIAAARSHSNGTRLSTRALGKMISKLFSEKRRRGLEPA